MIQEETQATQRTFDGPYGEQHLRIYDYGRGRLLEIDRPLGKNENPKGSVYNLASSRCFVRDGRVITQTLLSKKMLTELSHLIQYTNVQFERAHQQERRDLQWFEENCLVEKGSAQTQRTSHIVRSQTN